MAEKYDPTEAEIAGILAKFQPRQIAIAYLRAKRRAMDAETTAKVMGDICDLTRTAMTGDVSGAKRAVDKARQTIRTHNQAMEAK